MLHYESVFPFSMRNYLLRNYFGATTMFHNALYINCPNYLKDVETRSGNNYSIVKDTATHSHCFQSISFLTGKSCINEKGSIANNISYLPPSGVPRLPKPRGRRHAWVVLGCS